MKAEKMQFGVYLMKIKIFKVVQFPTAYIYCPFHFLPRALLPPKSSFLPSYLTLTLGNSVPLSVKASVKLSPGE